jgi:hypothetical protein
MCWLIFPPHSLCVGGLLWVLHLAVFRVVGLAKDGEVILGEVFLLQYVLQKVRGLWTRRS